MSRPMSFLAALLWLIILSTPCRAQDQTQEQAQPQPSLGDIARQARKDKEKNASKAKTVITDDTLPSSKGLGGLAGDLGGLPGGGGRGAEGQGLAENEENGGGAEEIGEPFRTTLGEGVFVDQECGY